MVQGIRLTFVLVPEVMNCELGKATFLKLGATALVQMYIGDGAHLVRDAFALAKEKAPTIIFIDELGKFTDTISVKLTDNEISYKSIFKTQLVRRDSTRKRPETEKCSGQCSSCSTSWTASSQMTTSKSSPPLTGSIFLIRLSSDPVFLGKLTG